MGYSLTSTSIPPLVKTVRRVGRVKVKNFNQIAFSKLEKFQSATNPLPSTIGKSIENISSFDSTS